MELSKIRNRYRIGLYAVYPLAIKSQLPESGRIKIVSSRKAGKWFETDHYGDYPLNTWINVFDFMENEINKLKKLNAYSYISKNSVREYYEQLNPPARVINLPEQDDINNLMISLEGVSSIWNFIDNTEDDPRFNPGYWEIILRSWIYSYKMLQEDFKVGKLVNL